MISTHRIVIILLVFCLFPLIAQAQFGTVVGVHDGEIFVMKPGGAFGGLAVVSVFGKEQGAGWYLNQRIITDDAYATGRPLSPSMWSHNGALFLAGADPHVKLGAYIYNKDNTGWTETGAILVDPIPEKAAAENMQVSDFMRYVAPAQRVVAGTDDLLAIGITRSPWSKAGVHLFERTQGDGICNAHLTHPRDDRNGQFGASVALESQTLVAGSPGSNASGRAFVYTCDTAGGWSVQDTLKVDALEKSAGFGSSVLFSSGQIIVSAPGAADAQGAVFVFERSAGTGGWDMVLRIQRPDAEPKDLFGTSIAMVGEELWIGAPNAGESGRVFRYAKGAGDERFINKGTLTVNDLERASQFGNAIAGTDQLAVVGVPGGNGGLGKAVVFEKDAEGAWLVAAHLLPGDVLTTIAGKEVSCEDGKAAQFDCEGIDLLSFLPMDGFGAEASERVSDLWGWTDPVTQHEYALLGRTAGAAIIDVTNPVFPVYMGLVPANLTPTRDLKVYKDHLFFTGDGADDHGLVIFDLKRLRNVVELPTTFAADTVYTGIASAHNLIIDEESGFAYPVGASRGGETCGGGLHMVDIREPLKPSFAGCYTDTIGLFSDGRTHDGQCVVYTGPDDRYAGRQVCFVSNETALRIVDVTDKSNPEPLAAAKYPRVAYVHQGWLTDDHRYFYLDDELDELVGMTNKTRTMVWDIAELDDPVLVGEFEGSSTATDHNLYIKGDRMYQANYQAGLRLWDISDPEHPFEIGHFDTTPNDANPPGFVGAWTAYPYFESGTIIVSSMNEGLFMVKPAQREMP